jgi:hypothetical protein
VSYVTHPHLPVKGVCMKGKNAGRPYDGHAATKEDRYLRAWPRGTNGDDRAVARKDASELERRRLDEWKTRVDVGDS